MLVSRIPVKTVAHAFLMNTLGPLHVVAHQDIVVEHVTSVSWMSISPSRFRTEYYSPIDNALTMPPFDPCSPNPCRNGGTCQSNGAGSFTCSCPVGFSGYCCEMREYSFLLNRKHSHRLKLIPSNRKRSLCTKSMSERWSMHFNWFIIHV